MPYGEPQLQTGDVKYKVDLSHVGGGFLSVTAVAYEAEREADNDVAVQAAIDLLVANGFALDGAWKTMQAGITITATPPE